MPASDNVCLGVDGPEWMRARSITGAIGAGIGMLTDSYVTQPAGLLAACIPPTGQAHCV